MAPLTIWLFIYAFSSFQQIKGDTTTNPVSTTLAAGIFDNCTASGAYMNATISPNFDYIYSPGYSSGAYPSNTVCRWYVTAPVNYAVEAYFDNKTYAIESNSYCRYDYVTFYDGNKTTDTMLNKFCGSVHPNSTYRSSSTQMLILFSSDYLIQKAGFRIRIKAVDNTYPGCKANYTTYNVLYNRLEDYLFNNYTFINNISSPGFGTDYPLNTELFWLFYNANTTGYRIVLDIISISIERSYRCIYDRLMLYNGPCIKDGILDTVCGYWRKQWNLEGAEYLLHFHSDGYLTRSGFLINYYAEEKSVAIEPTTSTTTFGPPVGAVVDAVKEMLTNYSNENLPARDLSEAIRAYVDFYFVGINGLDEVEQKLTSTGQFEVSWEDPSLSWDPTKRQGVVQVLLPQNDLWKPDIALMNGFSKITAMGAKFMFIDINYNGSCIWKPYQVMESVCKVDMTHYPYDRQICILKFGTWSSDDSEVLTELGSLGLQIHPNFQENSEWRLISTETKQEINNNHKVVEFYLTIERNSRYVTYYMTIPIIMLAYMNVITFIIPTESGEKSGFSVTIFLSFVVLLIINNDSLPDNSDTISLYAAFLLTMTIMSAIALLISVLQIRAISLERRRYPLPKCFESMIYHITKLRAYLPFSNTGDKSKRKKKEKEEIGESSINTKGDNDATASDSSGYYSSPSSKKRTVAFKIDNDDNSETEENDRFVFPRKREVSNVTFKRETTLFEENAIIRPSTPSTILFPNKGKETLDKPKEIGPLLQKQDEEHNSNLKPKSETPDDGQKGQKERESEENIRKAIEENGITSYSGSQHVHSTNSEYDLYELEHFKEEFARGTSFINDGKEETFVSEATQGGENQRQSSNDDKSVKEEETDSEMNEAENNGSINERSENVGKKENVNTVLNIINDKQTDSNSPEHTSQNNDNLSDGLVKINSSGYTEKNKSREVQINIESVAHQSGSIFDEIMDLQATSAKDFKMNRPASVEDNRSSSVNRLFSAEERGLASANIGRALSVTTSRPVSRVDNRALSVLTQRPMSIASRKRPASVLSQNYNTAILFGDEEVEQEEKQGTDIDNASQVSQEQPSESDESSTLTEDSDESGEDGPEWSDFVSCTDVIFFVIYLFITTLMSLAIFLTMVTAF